jgi:hypothetical protein
LGGSADRGNIGQTCVLERIMRLFGAVVMIAGMVWLVVGCGDAVGPLLGKARSGLVLADSENSARYSFTVVNGAPALTKVEGVEAVRTDSSLVDRATGARYSVEVTAGALTLVRGESVNPGVAQIGLTDSVTAKTYALGVASGALTLTPE